MPAGGVITIEAGNKHLQKGQVPGLDDGAYVCIAVSVACCLVK